MKKIKEFFMKLKKKRQLKKLREQIINGAIFLRIINDELQRIERTKRKRIIEDMMKKGRLNSEIVQACEIKAEFILKAMEGELRLYKKKKKADIVQQNKRRLKDVKKNAERVKPTVKQKADVTYVNGEKQKPKDSKEFYDENKKKENEGTLSEE